MADDDPYTPPPIALMTTKYVHDCGGVSVDLEPDMPPIDEQENAPWCATFAAKAVLEYQNHIAHPDDHYQTRLSAMDINSLNTGKPSADRGKSPDMNNGDSPLELLEGVQASGEVYRDQDYPFEQTYFENPGIMSKFSKYYETEKPYDAASQLACRPQDPDTQLLEKYFTSLLQLLHSSNNETAFLNTADAKYSLVTQPKKSAKRVSISPPYDILQDNAKTGDRFMETLQANLKAKEPSIIGLCGDQLSQMPGIGSTDSVPPALIATCGPHAVDVVGMKMVNGVCQVELRNSWGTGWPPSSKGGTAWIAAANLLKILPTTPDGRTEIDSIRTRKPGTPIENQINVEGVSTYVGKSFQGQPNGPGKVVFQDGTIESGLFSNGLITQGYYQGIYDPTHGIYYDGPIVNGAGTSDGKFTDKNGDPVTY